MFDHGASAEAKKLLPGLPCIAYDDKLCLAE